MGRNERTGVQRIADERARQVGEEGWTSMHDDDHEKGELFLVAALYASPVELLRVFADGEGSPGIHFVDPWPASWSRTLDKRRRRRGGTSAGRIRELEKAGALVAAEIDRLLRLEEGANSVEIGVDAPDRYPGQGDRVLVLLRDSRRFMNGTVSKCNSIRFEVRESWNHSWPYGEYGKTWLWDDGSGRIVEVSESGDLGSVSLKPWKPLGRL